MGTAEEARKYGVSAIVGVKAELPDLSRLPSPVILQPPQTLTIGDDWKKFPFGNFPPPDQLPAGINWRQLGLPPMFHGPGQTPGGVAMTMVHALVDRGCWPVVTFSPLMYELTAFGSSSGPAQGG